jgi:hypothetical protein
MKNETKTFLSGGPARKKQEERGGCLGCLIAFFAIIIIAIIIGVSTDDTSKNRNDTSRNRYSYDFRVGDDMFFEPTHTETSDEFYGTATLHKKSVFIKIVGLRPSNVVTMRKGQSYLVKIHEKRPTGNNHYYVTPYAR